MENRLRNRDLPLKERLEIVGKMNLRRRQNIEIIINNTFYRKKGDDHRETGYFQEVRNVDLCFLGSGRYPYLVYCRKKSNKKENLREEMVCVDYIMNINKLEK